MIGKKFSRLIVIDFHHSDDGKYWLCLCSCGNSAIAKTGHLNSGSIKSCGCLLDESRKVNLLPGGNKTHGLSRSRLDEVFDNMLKRCYEKTNKRYDRYGGRGILICDEWLSDRSKFFDWALSNGYQDYLFIDREDNDLGYYPENCRFVTAKVQANNTCRNHRILWNGKNLTLSQWEDETGINQYALRKRIVAGWDIEKALTKPLRVSSS